MSQATGNNCKKIEEINPYVFTGIVEGLRNDFARHDCVRSGSDFRILPKEQYEVHQDLSNTAIP